MPDEPKVHVHLRVSDLEKSKRFYSAFLGTPPAKDRPGYAKFLPTFGPLNLALSEGVSGDRRKADHLGIQVGSPAAVRAEMARVRAAGLPVREEIGVSCCHANQDKFWVEDPDGVRWEVYHLNFDLEDSKDVSAAGFAGPGCCPDPGDAAPRAGEPAGCCPTS